MTRRGLLVAALLAALALLVAACGSDSGNETEAAAGDEAGNSDVEPASAETGEVTYVATEFAFEGPDVIPAGETTLVLENEGEQAHEMAVTELLDGKTIADVEALFEKGMPNKPPKWARDVGGTGAKSGGSGSLEADLTPGTYVFLCFVPDHESKQPHVMLGMLKEVTVE